MTKAEHKAYTMTNASGQHLYRTDINDKSLLTLLITREVLRRVLSGVGEQEMSLDDWNDTYKLVCDKLREKA
tara:strand:+ start:330 stop:545 length:216 start_codon:yes stop_codon:yes gene_type:complete